MTEVSVAIDVPAPPELIWRVLTDTDAYPRWNTLLSVRGDLAVGERPAVRLSIPGLPTVPISPEITAVDPERALRWRSRLFGIEADHAFLLEPLDDGGTRFVQTEQFSGVVAGPVVDRLERHIRRGFEQMNVGLRRRAVELRDRESRTE
ncbi:SRPBCC domain-containing protein [Haloarcula sp. S1CR25-12]|uniref:SRPBCC domain-containing protein n=1 Tax=Haloarcula saliterrae TaxID=2950534 RepID=A0ABU2F9L5_9EURY|nr:SRPBCC domain-containing protein [Haloarcula sp. S1CR25-12]MDS0258924.1 SRPBCC domain-containing protein [Haloarcula sp. S1CR25-12]